MTSVRRSLAFARRPQHLALAAAAAVAAASAVSPVQAAALPEIRSSAQNAVPACVTPDRLMSFLSRRNGQLPPRFREIASYYKLYGETWRVRWDYAFFQMAIETNFLTYRAPNGRMGDVDPAQNNFAGIGTTGGGVPGDRFPDVKTGVLAQIQHLVVYSGEMIENPVAPRTQLKQEHILTKSRELNRPVRFSDLAGRWAADRKYASSIEWVADAYRTEECRGKKDPPREQPEDLPWQKPQAQTNAGAAASGRDTAVSASSPVRTVWSREAEKKTAKRTPPPKREIVVSATEVPPEAPPAPAKPDGVAEMIAGPAASAQPAQGFAPSEPAAAAPEERFALFAPPAGLADVKLAGPPPRAKAADVPAPNTVAGWQDKPAPAAALVPPIAPPPEATVPSVAPSDPPAEIAGPLAPPTAPQAVADASPAQDGKAGFDPPSGLGVKPGRCMVEAASYGGETTVLVKAPEGGDVHYIAVSVLDGFEANMTQTFLSSRPEGGEAIGTFTSKDAALTKARELCPAD